MQPRGVVKLPHYNGACCQQTTFCAAVRVVCESAVMLVLFSREYDCSLSLCAILPQALDGWHEGYLNPCYHCNGHISQQRLVEGGQLRACTIGIIVVHNVWVTA